MIAYVLASTEVSFKARLRLSVFAVMDCSVGSAPTLPRILDSKHRESLVSGFRRTPAGQATNWSDTSVSYEDCYAG